MKKEQQCSEVSLTDEMPRSEKVCDAIKGGRLTHDRSRVKQSAWSASSTAPSASVVAAFAPFGHPRLWRHPCRPLAPSTVKDGRTYRYYLYIQVMVRSETVCDAIKGGRLTHDRSHVKQSIQSETLAHIAIIFVFK
jgi:hypothetical protein